ncbi:MAG: CinA family protein [Candidatus Dormibacteria bacterium]
MAETYLLGDAFPEVAEVARALRAAQLTVAVAESCTGGLLGAVLTSLPGASDYMRGGVIAYADSMKADLLGVSRHELAEHGAVSEPVARAMAEGTLLRCHASLGVAITGVAGPDGGTAAKPVGLIYVSLVTVSGGGVVRRLEGDRGRDANRARAVRAALALCLEAASAPPPTG